MSIIGTFFGSDTGNTKRVAQSITENFNNKQVKLYDIASSSKKDIEEYDILLFGISTWYYGEPQCDWEDFFPTLEQINFTNKLVALFGCGDQEDYSEYFCDALGLIRNIIEPHGAIILGHWSIKGYHFEASKSLVDDAHFVGLTIDEDRQPELTNRRIKQWVEQLYEELQLNLKLDN